jgi:anti-anti-sigma factor
MAKLDLNVIGKKSDDQKFVIVEFKGEMDKSNISDIRTVLLDFIEKFSDEALIFDLTYFDFINSEGVGLMVSLYYKVNKLGKKLFIINPQPQVNDVFGLIGLTNVVKPLSSVEEAISLIN